MDAARSDRVSPLAMERSVRAAFESGDPETWFDLLADDFEFEMPHRSTHLPDFPTRLCGKPAAQTMFLSFWSSWEEYAIEVTDAARVGDWLLIEQRERLRGKTSGLVLDRTSCALMLFQAGKLQRLRLYPSRAEALAALAPEGA